MVTSAIIFLCAIVFCVGAAVGGLIERGLNKRSAPRASTPPGKNELAKAGDSEVVSAWRGTNQQVWLEMDGRRLDNKEALMPEQRQSLLSLVLDLRPWLETAQPSTGPATAPKPVQPAAPVDGVTVQPVQPATPAAGITAQPGQTKKNQPAPAGEAAKPAPVPESIIEQIDKVLQAKLTTSALNDRGIRLTEGPSGIVIIQDGANQYEGIDAISDPQVKALIQQAVADWEKGTK